MELVSAETVVSSSKEKGKKTIQIPSEYMKYSLNLILRSEREIIFYNAQNLSFYDRIVENPISKIWLLRRNLDYNYSMRRLIEQAYEMRIQLDNVKIQDFEVVVSNDGLDELLFRGNRIDRSMLPHAILPRFGANIDGWSMAVLRHLELMGCRLINDVASLEISKDKMLTYQALSSAKLPIPKTILLRMPVNMAVVKSEFGGFPIILKNCSGGQGKGVALIHSQEFLSDAIDMMDKTHPYVLQEFIKNSSGRDIRVIVVGGRIVSSMMRIASTGFKSNFHQGGSVKCVEINDAIESLCVTAVKTLGLEIAGVDLLIGSDGYTICEINSSPGFEGFELATGVNTAQEILKYTLDCKPKSLKNVTTEKVVIPINPKHLE